MKFSFKLLVSMMMILAAALGFSGFYFVNYVFHTSLEREVGQALDESSILCFALETAALNVPAQYGILPDRTAEQLVLGLETGGKNTRRLLRLSSEEKEILYASEGFGADEALLVQAETDIRSYRVLKLEEHYYIQTVSAVQALDRMLYLETLRDISGVFEERALGFLVYRRVTLLMLAAGVVLIYLISPLLVRPIRILAGATRRMAAGEYGYRARKVSQDELGQLTDDFNRMAGALEDNVHRLEEEIQDREAFVGAFAHELKTPLTAIIGYADMLRSRRLSEEKSFLAAQYIYSEGKRLESMSFRLLDIIVTKRDSVSFQKVPAAVLFSYLKEAFQNSGKDSWQMEFSWEEENVWAEADLIKSVLLNLLDNACKASEPGGRIEVTGKKEEMGYCFSVRDYGVGIPEEELGKITKAFYMVDKSRSRSRNGAGLGLALCAEILMLHESRLTVESRPGEGTCMSFLLPLAAEETEGGIDE